MVVIKKLYQTDFYKNDTSTGGAMIEAIKHKGSSHVVVHLHNETKKEGRMWGSMSPDNFIRLLDKHRGIHEVIHQFPHKVYFDIDKPGLQEPTFLEQVKGIIWQFFPFAEMAISGSFHETKTSFHIALQNYFICNEEQREKVKHLVMYIAQHLEPAFDSRVYNKNRNMKCINQCKKDGRIQAILENSDFRAHCITCYLPETSLPYIEWPEPVQEVLMIAKANKPFDLSTLPSLTLPTPEEFDKETATMESILMLAPVDQSFDHSYTHRVARFCYHNSLPLELFLTWISRKHNPMTSDIATKWRGHWDRMDKFPEVTRDAMIDTLCHFYPDIKRDYHYRKFKSSFDLPQENIQKIEAIAQSSFTDSSEKYLIFNVGMGGGKTAQAISYLKNQQQFCWIAPNRALATNTRKRFMDEKIDVFHYEYMSAAEKKQGLLAQEWKLIVCLNSLHYVRDMNYRVLVIDEPETLFDKFLGPFMEQGPKMLKSKIWEIMVRLFRSADKVLLLDAFITKKTIDFIRSVEGAGFRDFAIFERIRESQTRQVTIVKNYMEMEFDIIAKLRDGLKVFIFYPFKRETNNNPSMETFFLKIQQTSGKPGIYYNADVDDEIKVGLQDVNKSWEKPKFIVSNNILTCGVNYDVEDFDFCYIYVASHNTPRDIIQVSYRARYLSTGRIMLSYWGKMEQPASWFTASDISCPIFDTLHRNILIERKAPIKRALQLFCRKAHYGNLDQELVINEALKKEINAFRIQGGVAWQYSKLEDIDEDRAADIEMLCFAQQATMTEKYQKRKFHFKQRFVAEADQDTLGQIWDDNWEQFFVRLKEVLCSGLRPPTTPVRKTSAGGTAPLRPPTSSSIRRLGPEPQSGIDKHLFIKIAEHNGLWQEGRLFPTDLSAMKLTPEHKAEIFQMFTFKYVTQESRTNKILQEIYNTFFEKHIIGTHHSKGGHVSYYIREEVDDFFEFAKANLILDRENDKTYDALFGEPVCLIEV